MSYDMNRTTAAELIEMLQELPPETHVFVDIGVFDWEVSDIIRPQKIEDERSVGGKVGAFHLTGYTA